MKPLAWIPFVLSLGSIQACNAGDAVAEPAPETTAGLLEEAAAPVPAEEFAKPGYFVAEEDGRLWVFRAGSEELEQYLALGEPAKHYTRVGAGPGRRTVKAPDKETAIEYLVAAEGFETFVVDGRIWVFRTGDPAIEEFRRMGEPAKHVIRPAAGPMGMTVKGPDKETLDAYLRVVG